MNNSNSSIVCVSYVDDAPYTMEKLNTLEPTLTLGHLLCMFLP